MRNNDCDIDLSKGRLTKAKLVKWINSEFIKLEINEYRVFKIEQTKFSGKEYECGAAFLNVWFYDINDSEDVDCFQVFYRISDLDYYAKNGKVLSLRIKRLSMSLRDLEIHVN